MVTDWFNSCSPWALSEAAHSHTQRDRLLLADDRVYQQVYWYNRNYIRRVWAAKLGVLI